MKLLTVLFAGFLLGLGIAKILGGFWDFKFAGNMGMACFLIFTGLAHFRFQRGMAMMIPDVFPAKMFLVYFTGILEIAAAICLLIPELRRVTGILLIIFLIIIFFANINSSRRNVNLFKADHSGPGMQYLFRERLPMQLFLIAWTWYFSIYL